MNSDASYQRAPWRGATLALFVSCAVLSSCSDEQLPQATGTEVDPAALARLEDVERTEDLIDGLLPDRFVQLKKSLLNLRFPDSYSQDVFEPTIDVIDIVEPGSSEPVIGVPGVRSLWKLGELERGRQVTAGMLWRPYLGEMVHISNLQLKAKRGEFLDQGETEFKALMLFGALGYDGERYHHASAKMYVTWARTDVEGGDPLWRIRRFETTQFETATVDDMLFSEDVFPAALVDEDAAEFLFSQRHHLAETILNNIQNGVTFDDLKKKVEFQVPLYTQEVIEHAVKGMTELQQRFLNLHFGQDLPVDRVCRELEIQHDKYTALRNVVTRKLDVSAAKIRPEAVSLINDIDELTSDIEAIPFVTLVDFDRDGWDDIFVRARRTFLFRNQQDGTFTDVLEDVGLGMLAERRMITALFADFDNDDDDDLITGFLDGLNFFRNDDGRFVEVEKPYKGPRTPFVRSLSAADYDSDGLLDLFVATQDINAAAIDMRKAHLSGIERDKLLAGKLPDYLAKELYKRATSPDAHGLYNRPGPPNCILKNVGGFKFKIPPANRDILGFLNAHQATWADYDLDGHPDLYIANDWGPNELYHNLGNGRFEDVAAQTGTIDTGFGMGVSWGDYDNDGLEDLYVTNMYSKAGLRITNQAGMEGTLEENSARGNTLYKNDGEGGFTKVSGLEPPALLVEAAGWGWGGQFIDFNNDGWLDIYSPCGRDTPPEEIGGINDT